MIHRTRVLRGYSSSLRAMRDDINAMLVPIGEHDAVTDRSRCMGSEFLIGCIVSRPGTEVEGRVQGSEVLGDDEEDTP
jgi:hypothetical protein